jgi:hypothetical protein
MGIPFIMHYRTQLEFRASFDANDTRPQPSEDGVGIFGK